MAVVALLVAALLLAVPNAASACMCGGGPPCHRFWSADAVFTGVVTDITRTVTDKKNLSHTTFVVERGFRNASGKIVIDGNERSSCHYRFVVGQRYVLYAFRQADGSLTTDRCAGNKILADADEDLDYADHLPPPGSGGRIFGRVTRNSADVEYMEARQDEFPRGITVTVRDSAGAPMILPIDREGNFEGVGLKAGTYSLAVTAPATTLVRLSDRAISLKDRSCAPVSVHLEFNGRIRGRIVDSDGNPLGNVRVAVLPAWFTNKSEYSNVHAATARADAAGRYEIGPLSPGEYRVGVNINQPPTLKAPYPPTYYPGVSTRSEATLISVGEGEASEATFAVPPKLASLVIKGVVLFPDDTPAADVVVGIRLRDHTVISMTRTNASGAFTLAALSGSDYLVSAAVFAGGAQVASAEASISLADEPLTGVTLILQKR